MRPRRFRQRIRPTHHRPQPPRLGQLNQLEHNLRRTGVGIAVAVPASDSAGTWFNLVAITQAMGATSERSEYLDHSVPALSHALRHLGPTLLYIIIDASAWVRSITRLGCDWSKPTHSAHAHAAKRLTEVARFAAVSSCRSPAQTDSSRQFQRAIGATAAVFEYVARSLFAVASRKIAVCAAECPNRDFHSHAAGGNASARTRTLVVL